MKPKDILHAMNDIDCELLETAERKSKKPKRNLIKWCSAAACFAVVAAAGVFLIPKINDVLTNKTNESVTMIDGIERRYKKSAVAAGESAVIWPWEYLTPAEQYTFMVFNGTAYRTRGRSVGEGFLSVSLGTCTAEGYDVYTEKKYTKEFEVRAIGNVDRGNMVAVCMEGEYIVFLRDDNPFPSNFGEFLSAYALAENLSLSRFSVQGGFENKGHYIVKEDDYIWQVLSQCTYAPRVEDNNWDRGDRNYLSFTATSEPLGFYKKVLYVTEDGFVWTNILDYAYIFEIGTEAAEQIITYAKENSTETEAEPYRKSLSGTVVEIGADYILIDDSVLCVDENDGMVFKVPTHDLRIRRVIDSPVSTIEVGDVVVVEYNGTIDTANGNIVSGAFSISVGIIADGSVLIPE